MKVIGIAGPSCSRKSTISELVSFELNDAPIICLDYQYIKGSPDILYNGVRTFERPELYDGAHLATIAQHLKTNGNASFRELKNKKYEERHAVAKNYIILEGFLLFHYPELRKVCDKMFYIDIPWEEMVKRRKARLRYGPSDDGFFAIGQHELETYVLPQRDLPGVTVLDGMLAPDELTKTIVQRVINN